MTANQTHSSSQQRQGQQPRHHQNGGDRPGHNHGHHNPSQSQQIFAVTHPGMFHADDVFCGALTRSIVESRGDKYILFRTRDADMIGGADFVFDTGRIYDPETNRNDHHQPGGAGARQKGFQIPYSSFGLMWKKFGAEFCQRLARDLDIDLPRGEAVAVAQQVDNMLVQPIDANDTGFQKPRPEGDEKIRIYHLGTVIAAMNLSEFDIGFGAENAPEQDKAFERAAQFALTILQGEVKRAIVVIKNEPKAQRYVNTAESKNEARGTVNLIVEMPDLRGGWHRPVAKNKDIAFVITPADGHTWGIHAVSSGPGEHRIYFPAAWRGLDKEQLVPVSGLAGAVFCHDSGHYAVAATREDALAIARAALHAWTAA